MRTRPSARREAFSTVISFSAQVRAISVPFWRHHVSVIRLHRPRSIPRRQRVYGIGQPRLRLGETPMVQRLTPISGVPRRAARRRVAGGPVTAEDDKTSSAARGRAGPAGTTVRDGDSAREILGVRLTRTAKPAAAALDTLPRAGPGLSSGVCASGTKNRALGFHPSPELPGPRDASRHADGSLRENRTCAGRPDGKVAPSYRAPGN